MPDQSDMPCPSLTEDSCRDLLTRFAEVPDPRKPRGIRHSMATILAIGAAAVACGAQTFTAIGEWAADAPQWLLGKLGARRHPRQDRLVAPHEATLRRSIRDFDGEELDLVISAWLAEQAATSADDATDQSGDGSAATDSSGGDIGAQDAAGPGPAVAVDGKTLRGARRGDGTRVHLLSAIGHASGLVLAQREIAAKTNEIPELAPLLSGLDLTGLVITVDALHTQRDTAAHLVERGADYVLTVKANQPSLLGACQHALSGPASDFAPEHVGYDRGHGRTEQRTTRARSLTSTDGIDFPHAAQAFRIRRDTGGLDGQRTRKEIAYCLTSLTAQQAGPAHLGGYVRGHWSIENRLHRVRDGAYDEDRCQARAGTGPRALASLRNLAIGALRLRGHHNIASALRWTARDPARSLAILGIT